MLATEDAILEAARRLADAASSRPARVILFESYARGQAREDRDLDFLVAEPQLRGRWSPSASIPRPGGT